MPKRLLFFSLFTLCAQLICSAQTDVLTLKVLDKLTNEPVRGATVTLLPAADTLLTDVLGECTFSVQGVDKVAVSTPLSSGNTYMISQLVMQPIVVLDAQMMALPIVEIPSEIPSRAPSAPIVAPLIAPSPPTRLTGYDLRTEDESSLLFALNGVPGVRFESRGYGGSRRINIRGSLVRSPFAVRNIPMYIDEIPIIGPDGQAWLELVDPFDVGSMEIIKGPTAHKHGAGIGGALLFTSPELNSGRRTEMLTRQSAGSFGYYRSATSFQVGSEDISLRLSHVFQEAQGYRLQEYNRKNQVSMRLRYVLNNRLDYFIYGMQYNGRWGLPGGLTLDEANDDPTSAAQFSIDNNAHVDRFRVLGGVSQRYTGRRHKNITTVFANTTDKINPFGTSPFFNGYKDETATGEGIRSNSEYEVISNEKMEVKTRGILQFQSDRNSLEQTTNNLGAPGELVYVNQTESREFLGHGGIEMDYMGRLRATVNASYSARSIDSRNSIPDSSTTDQRFINRTFDNVSYTGGLSYRIWKSTFAYGEYSTGYSPPSNFELLDPENGVLSETLSSERAEQIEFGLRSFLGKKLTADVRAYRMFLRDAIRPQTDSLGIVRFVNQGTARFDGIEGVVAYREIWANGPVRSILVSATGSIQEYIQNGIGDPSESFQVAGVPTHTFSSELRVTTIGGFALMGRYQWVNSTPLTDNNSAWQAAYDVLNLRLNWTSNEISDRWKIDLFAGVQNILDEQYTTFALLNAFGGRFYNPMPNRSYYGGLQLRYRFE